MTSTYSSEIQLGDVTYSVRATTGQELVLDLLGADPEGAVIADGRLRLPVSGGITVGRLLGRVLDAHTRLEGPAKRLPANANQRWSEDLDEQLRTEWLTEAEGTAVDRIRAIARGMQRSPTAIRARLPRVGCDPDIPGRTLSAEAAKLMGVRSGKSQGEA